MKTTKLCTTCGYDKELSEFNRNRSRKDGYQTKCRLCDRIHARTLYPKYKDRHILRAGKRKQDLLQWLIEYKQDRCCSVCGDKRWYVLDFHHPDDNKEYNVAEMMARGFGQKKVLIEIAKCILLCSNCHRELHYKKRYLSGSGDCAVV